LKELQDLVHELKARGVALNATEQPVDTSTAAGKAFLDMLGVFAEFETNLPRERQLEGIAAAKARGVYVSGVRAGTLRCGSVGVMFAGGLPQGSGGAGGGGARKYAHPPILRRGVSCSGRSGLTEGS
jgi:hypothetical protein